MFTDYACLNRIAHTRTVFAFFITHRRRKKLTFHLLIVGRSAVLSR